MSDGEGLELEQRPQHKYHRVGRKAETQSVVSTKTVYTCVQNTGGKMEIEFVEPRFVCCSKIGWGTQFPRNVAPLNNFQIEKINTWFPVKP